MKSVQKIAKFRDVTRDPMSAEEKALRHPAEKLVFGFSVVINMLLMIVALLIVIYGPVSRRIQKLLEAGFFPIAKIERTDNELSKGTSSGGS
jgi:hypothetical protein